MLVRRANPLVAVRRPAVWVVVALIFSLAPAVYAKKKDKKEPIIEQAAPKPQIDTSRLVWPSPPDVARIKYLEEFTGEIADPAAAKPKKKKQGWMDRLAGIQTQDVSERKPVHVLAKPYGVAVDSKGRIYVGDTYVAAVFIFDPATKKVEFIRNGVEGRFKNIIGIALDETDRLFVSDAALHQISVFDANHKLEGVFGSSELGRPSGIAIDTENRFVYVVDTEKQHVAVFDADTYKLLRVIGGPAKSEGDDSPGTFALPTNVALDADRNVYVTDTLNNRVQIFDPDGNFISMFGKPGDGPGYFERPKGIGVDADAHIWVADAAQNRVQVFDKDGHLLAYFGVEGSYPGQFGLPSGLCIDKQNRVIVADQLKGRIQIFQYITDSQVAAEKAEREKRVGASAPQAPAEEVKK